MDKPAALRHLSPVHAVAIVLDDEGYDPLAIGDRLGLEPRAVMPLLHVARQKLAALEGTRHQNPTSSDETR